ncbi:hypothetical protein BDB00DRAFT_789625 [Zychaea mexicana]|uniref:uncharacterized protein n=1 Tax=Zychaea mexicana TaxID=64656 RepID=UPI0022FE9FAA|nr:uncharacterized protein BDB00DRAFT_789625 [Zychaea mexicana]KAI9491369.1 hypothetical protein BDB00DRAFT_789625 [Zychaea mexicana]
MLHEEDDPLSGSFFDGPNTSSSFFDAPNVNRSPLTTTTSFYASQYEEDPWSSIAGSPSVSTRFNEQSISASTPVLTSPMAEQNAFITSPTTMHRPATVVPENRTTSSSSSPAITVSNVLYGARLPEIYDTMYSQIQRYGRIPLPSLHRMLESSGVTAMDIEKIMRISVPSMTSDIGRTEFNVILALVACAQNRIALPEPTFNINNSSNNSYHSRQSSATAPTPKSDPLSNVLMNGDNISTPSSPPKSPKVNGAYPGMDAASTTTTIRDSNETKHRTTKSLDTQSWFQKVEEIKVTIAPEREGFIFFKHVNYIVESQKRSSIVLRRFSDFWWLMEVLGRRYPFRALPTLPPKKVGGRDSAFLEKRRKGLSRYINAVIRHPMLRNDDIVIKFLTEPSELAAWRKQHPPSLDEEYRREQHNIEEIQSMIPQTLEEQLRKARQRVDAGIEHYVNLCFIMERMIRRMHGQATDFVRYSITLNALAETEHRYHSDCEQCQQVVQGYENVAKHMQRESTILENQELEERRDKLGGSQIESLKKRIANNKTKVNQHKGVPGLEAEVARLEESLRNDQAELHDQECRQLYIQFCMWCELIYMHKQQAFVSSLYRSYVQEMMQYSKKRADNWKELEGLVFQMPVEAPLFK